MQTTANPALDDMFNRGDLFKSPSNASVFNEDIGLEQRQTSVSAPVQPAPIFSRPMVTEPRADLALEELPAHASPSPAAQPPQNKAPNPVPPAISEQVVRTAYVEPEMQLETLASTARELEPAKATEEPVKPAKVTAKPKKLKKAKAPINRAKAVRGLTFGMMLLGGAYFTMGSGAIGELDTSTITRKLTNLISPQYAPVQPVAPTRRVTSIEPTDDVSVTDLNDATPGALPAIARPEPIGLSAPDQQTTAPSSVSAPFPNAAQPATAAPPANVPVTPRPVIAPVAAQMPAAPTAMTTQAAVVPAASVTPAAPIAKPVPVPNASAQPVQAEPAPKLSASLPVAQPAKPALAAPSPVVKMASAPIKPVAAPVKPAPTPVANAAPKPSSPLPAVTAQPSKPSDTSGRMTVVREGKPGQVHDDDTIYPISTK